MIYNMLQGFMKEYPWIYPVCQSILSRSHVNVGMEVDAVGAKDKRKVQSVLEERGK